MSGKGQVVIWFVYFALAFIVIIISAILAPAGVQFTVASYNAGERILNNSLDDINDIQDSAIRNSINNTVTNARDAAQDNIEVNSAIFQYGWVIVIALVGFVIFLLTRQIVNAGQGGLF